VLARHSALPLAGPSRASQRGARARRDPRYPCRVADPHSFGRYRVTGTLGAGAMGEVYAAIDEVLGREVAVKTLRTHRSELAARMLDERFRLEARAIAALHHPGVVQVFDIDLSADPPYLVMERVAGPSLRERLAAGALGLDELRALGIQIARALAAAHAAGILHRDVKPANILAAGAGTWKLADFGVAHVPDSSLTLTGQFVGSPAYAPPEALIRGQSSAAGDVYGLGATLYEAAAGRWPRLDTQTGALLAPLPPLHDLAPGLPADLWAAIDRAVAAEPERRPSASELADALAGAVSAIRTGAAPSSGPSAGMHAGASLGASVQMASATGSGAPPVPGALRWRPWALGAAAVLALVAIAARGSSPGAALPRQSSSPSRDRDRDDRDDGEERREPREIRVTPPVGMDGKQTRDWNKIVEALDRGHYEDARHKLREFEDRYGQTDATRALAPQLDQLGPDVPRGPGGPPGHGRGKKHHE
jgi:tRNA A-37 threonylcarbamoyl transferase component Bud32